MNAWIELLMKRAAPWMPFIVCLLVSTLFVAALRSCAKSSVQPAVLAESEVVLALDEANTRADGIQLTAAEARDTAHTILMRLESMNARMEHINEMLQELRIRVEVAREVQTRLQPVQEQLSLCF